MSWNGEQSYYMSVTAEQAAALVVMAETFWGKPRGKSFEGCTSRLFLGTYRTLDENWIAEITRGRHASDAGYPHRIVMTPDGARTMKQLVEVSPDDLPTQTLVGIVFPYAYGGEFADCHPLSFVFAHDSAPRTSDRPWRLVTAVPFVAKWGGPEWPGHEQLDELRNQASRGLWYEGLFSYLGSAYWPEELLIARPSVVAVRDGCYIELKGGSPSLVTAFIHFSKHQLGLDCNSVPDVDTIVENDFRSDWELDFPADHCFDPTPSRIEYWQQAFGVEQSSADRADS